MKVSRSGLARHAGSAFILDQLSKALALWAVPFGHAFDGMGPFALIPRSNAAAAMGTLGSLDAGIRYPLLLGIPLLCLILIGLSFRQASTALSRQDRLLNLGLAWVLGGSAGNLFDRLVRGSVVDFIALRWDGHYPIVFNIADLVIVAGMGTLLVAAIRQSRMTLTPRG